MTEGGPPMRDLFEVPDLAAMDDTIVNGTYAPPPGAQQPLAMFKAARVDYSLHRLIHYTGTDPAHFQNIVILTNYQFYIDPIIHMAKDSVAAGENTCLVEQANKIYRKNGTEGHMDEQRHPKERKRNA